MDSINVRKRPGDWHAALASNDKWWGCGSTPEEAVQALRKNHPELPVDLPVQVNEDDSDERATIHAFTIATLLMHRQ